MIDPCFNTRRRTRAAARRIGKGLPVRSSGNDASCPYLMVGRGTSDHPHIVPGSYFDLRGAREQRIAESHGHRCRDVGEHRRRVARDQLVRHHARVCVAGNHHAAAVRRRRASTRRRQRRCESPGPPSPHVTSPTCDAWCPNVGRRLRQERDLLNQIGEYKDWSSALPSRSRSRRPSEADVARRRISQPLVRATF